MARSRSSSRAAKAGARSAGPCPTAAALRRERRKAYRSVGPEEGTGIIAEQRAEIDAKIKAHRAHCPTCKAAVTSPSGPLFGTPFQKEPPAICRNCGHTEPQHDLVGGTCRTCEFSPKVICKGEACQGFAACATPEEAKAARRRCWAKDPLADDDDDSDKNHPIPTAQIMARIVRDHDHLRRPPPPPKKEEVPAAA